MCRHYQGAAKCDAYPNHVPEPIITGEHDHRTAYPGDHGLRFEPIKQADAIDSDE